MRGSENHNPHTNQARPRKLLRENLRLARQLLGGTLQTRVAKSLEILSQEFTFSLGNGELQFINNSWYVTHTGLLRLARRKRCRGIHVEAVDSLCDSATNRYVLKATVYPSKDSAGFAGYGDADPSNVSLLVRGAEMPIAGTRAVSRTLQSLLSPFHLRLAFSAWRLQGIGILPNLYQGALEKELDLLIRRAMFPFREFSYSRLQAGSYFG